MELLKKHLFPIILILTSVFIAFLNYTPGTFLTGWDTLHPEFDFALNFKRLFFGVWREEQGLGALAGHSHMADLPRVIFLWLFDLIAPVNMVRYLYVFLCLILGPLGIYYLISYILQKKTKHLPLVAFLSAMFYLLNLSTVQQFYVPFEMFTVQYAALPWIILFTIKFLKEGGKKNLLLFSLTTLLATPQAYAAHLWYPFFGTYCLFLLFYLLFDLKLATFKKVFLLGLATIIMNSYWLLPNLYFITTSSNIPKESKQNRIFSQEFRLRNRENGYLKDVALARGFYFNWSIYNFEKERNENLMPNWQKHLENPFIISIGYIFFVLSITGFIYAIRKKDKLYIALFPFFILPFVFLMNHTFPFDLFFNFLLTFPVSEEALRFVFTKFSILLIFSYVIYFSYFLLLLFGKMSTKKIAVISGALIIALILFSSPMFRGDLISSKMRVKIPNQYFEFWKYMQTQPDGTVLSLPLYTFSGWQYYDWEYQGAGFIWFGLKQPILDRDFDRWSMSNEQTFREFQHSLYIKNPDLFDVNLKKYNITYILRDKSNNPTSFKNKKQITYARETDTILSSLISDKKIIKLKTIDNLEIYQTTKTYPSIKVQSELPFVAPPYRLQEFDHSYSQLGDYQTSTNTNVPSDFFYPFRNVMDKSERVKPDILQVDSTTNSYFIQNKISNQHKKIFIPSYLSTEESLFTNLYISKSKIRNTYTLTFELLLPKKFTDPITYYAQFPSTSPTISFKLNGKSFKIDKSVLSSDPIYIGQAFIFTRIPNYLNNQEIKLVFDSNPNLKGPAPLFAKFPLQKITYTATDIYKSRINEDGIKFNDNKVTFKNNNYQTGIYLDLSYLPHNSGYFLIFKARNKTGLPLRFCFKNLYSNLCSIYDELSKKNTFTNDYFLIPPSDDGMGYGLSIDNISFGFYDSENEIEEITIIPFPHNFLSQIYFYNKMIPVADSELIIKKTDHSKPYKWEIKTSGNLDNGILTLNQSFHPGWKAYVLTSNNLPFIFGKELTEHKLINNWANGWVLRPNLGNPEKIIIVFWPQYLQFMGYGLVVVFIISILSIHLHTHRTHRKKS